MLRKLRKLKKGNEKKRCELGSWSDERNKGNLRRWKKKKIGRRLEVNGWLVVEIVLKGVVQIKLWEMEALGK